MRHRSHRIQHDGDAAAAGRRKIAEGMTFHVLSWLMETGRGDSYFSNTVLVGLSGAEVLTRTAGDLVAEQ